METLWSAEPTSRWMCSGPNENDTPSPHRGLDVRAADAGVALLQRAAHDGDRAGGDVVVVPAGVVLGRPAQQPDVDVVITVERDVVSLARRGRPRVHAMTRRLAPGRPRARGARDLSRVRSGSDSKDIGSLLSDQSAGPGSKPGWRVRRPRPDRGRRAVVRTAGPSRTRSCRCRAPERRVDGTRPVGRGFKEHVAVDLAATAAAYGEPLAVQRGQAGEQGEAHPQPRMPRTPERAEREPRRVHLLDVRDQRGPPRRPARRRARARGARTAAAPVTRAASAEARSGHNPRRRAVRSPGSWRPGSRGRAHRADARGSISPTEAAAQAPNGAGRARPRPRGTPPAAARRLRGPATPRRAARTATSAPGRSRRRRRERCGGRFMIAGTDVVGRLPIQMQRPAVESRRLRTPAQSVDEPGAPQVLVYVGGHGAPV